MSSWQEGGCTGPVEPYLRSVLPCSHWNVASPRAKSVGEMASRQLGGWSVAGLQFGFQVIPKQHSGFSGWSFYGPQIHKYVIFLFVSLFIPLSC